MKRLRAMATQLGIFISRFISARVFFFFFAIDCTSTGSSKGYRYETIKLGQCSWNSQMAVGKSKGNEKNVFISFARFNLSASLSSFSLVLDLSFYFLLRLYSCLFDLPLRTAPQQDMNFVQRLRRVDEAGFE